MTTTPNTTASGAADRPEALKLASILRGLDTRHYFGNKKLVAAADELERLHALAASAPVAPAPQPVPEALRLAEMLTADEWPGSVTLVSYARECVAELRRLHAENERLAAAPKAAPPAPLQQGGYLPLPTRPEPDGFITIKIIGRDVEVNAYRDSTLEAFAHAAIDADRASRGAAQAAPAEPDMRSVALAAGAYTTAYSMLTHAKVHNADVAGSTSRLVAATNGLRSALGQTAPVAEYALRLEGTDMDAERRKMQHYDDPFVMPLDGTQAAQPEGGATA